MKNNWGRLFFITGAVLLVLMSAVHSISLFQKPMIRNESEKQLVDLMTNYRFTVMGSVRTMNDFVRGFSISFGLATLGFAVLDFGVCRERAQLLKRVALCNVLWLVAMTVISWHYFFAAPASFLTVTLIIFALAWVKLPATETSQVDARKVPNG
jgi:hypothetical protein